LIEMAIVIAVGLMGGVAVGTQVPIAGAMAQRIGGASSSFIVHLGGAAASLVLLVFRRGELIHEWRTLPWYMLGCGALGLVLYLTLSHTIPKLGATSAITLIVVGQLLVGLVIDYFGAFGVPVRELGVNRIIGALLLLAGAFLMVR
jgi:transporter family-2 protein